MCYWRKRPFPNWGIWWWNLPGHFGSCDWGRKIPSFWLIFSSPEIDTPCVRQFFEKVFIFLIIFCVGKSWKEFAKRTCRSAESCWIAVPSSTNCVRLAGRISGENCRKTGVFSIFKTSRLPRSFSMGKLVKLPSPISANCFICTRIGPNVPPSSSVILGELNRKTLSVRSPTGMRLALVKSVTKSTSSHAMS